MPKQITITVEDDVADWLEQQDDVAALVSKLMVRPMPPLPLPRPKLDPQALQALREEMESRSTEEGRAEARRKIAEAEAKMTPELKEWSRKLFESYGIHRPHKSRQA